MKHDDTPVPRLADSMSSVFARAEAEYRNDIDEARAWQRLQSRLPAELPPVAARRYRWAVIAAAACLMLGWFGWHRFHATLTPSRSTASVASSQALPGVANASIRLAAGRSTLPDGTAVELVDGAVGTYEASASKSILGFHRGKLAIAVAHQQPGHSFAVMANGFEFVVLGTKFTVDIAGSRVALNVIEGRVAVHDNQQLLRVVEAGGHWSNEQDPAEPPAPSASTLRNAPVATSPKIEVAASSEAAKPSDPSSCRDLLRSGKPGPAEQCYLAIASGSGLSAEMSLYEIARLRRDVLANPSTSLAALDTYESRFPSGTFAPEVRAARVDLLARLGRVDEALTVSAQLLTSPSGRGRSVELRLLRGNLLRDNKHDCTAAIAEYQQIESDPGPRGDQAQFAHARCLQQMGKNDAAIRIYQGYLGRPNPQRADSAHKFIEELTP